MPKKNHVDQAKKLRLANSQHSRPSWLDGSPQLEVTAKMLDQMLPLAIVQCLQKHVLCLLSFVCVCGYECVWCFWVWYIYINARRLVKVEEWEEHVRYPTLALYSLRLHFLLNLEPDWSPTNQMILLSPLSLLPGVTNACIATFNFLNGAWASNSGSPACVATTLTLWESSLALRCDF